MSFTLPNEIIYHILSYTNINTIKNYCHTTKIQPLYNDKLFWINLFNKFNLPLFNTNPSNWIKEYIKVQDAINEVRNMYYILIEDWYQYIYIDIMIDNEKQRTVLDYAVQEERQNHNDYDFIYLFTSPVYSADFEPIQLKQHDRFTYDSVQSLLLKSIILYPNCEISTRRSLKKEHSIREGKLNLRQRNLIKKHIKKIKFKK
jgi:hypothetical protein